MSKSRWLNKSHKRNSHSDAEHSTPGPSIIFERVEKIVIFVLPALSAQLVRAMISYKVLGYTDRRISASLDTRWQGQGWYKNF